MSDRFVDEVRFFLPSPGLTKALFAEVEAVRRNDQIRVSEDREQAEVADDDYMQNITPDGSAQAGIYESQGSEEAVFLQQRFIAEELYHHLAFFSRSPPAKRGHPLPIVDMVAHGMGDVLGLPREGPLLRRLADEFKGWLSEFGQFTAGWGTILLADGNRIYLEEIHPPEVETAARPRRVFIPRQDHVGERDRRRRESGEGKGRRESG